MTAFGSRLVGSTIVIATLVLGSGSPAHGQAIPKFEKMGDVEAVKDVEEVEWTAKAEAGLLASTGNSRTTTLTGSAVAIRKDVRNKLEAKLTGTYARATIRTATDANADGAISSDELGSASTTSAENAALKIRYDQFLSDTNAIYVAALGAIDQPAGKDLQGGAQLGYSRSLFKNDCHQVLGELGYDLNHIQLSAGSSSTVHSARAFAGYQGKLNDETSLEASLEGLINGNSVTYGTREAGVAEATRATGIIGVTTSLSTNLSLNAGFTVKYEQFPAPLGTIGGIPFAAGFEPAAGDFETLTKITLIVNLL